MNKTLWLTVLLLACGGKDTEVETPDTEETDAVGFEDCGDTLVDVRDEAVYRTVEIDGACWMAENLNIGTYIPTTTAGHEMSDDGAIEKYCYDNVPEKCEGTNGEFKHGGMYEWTEMVHYAANPSDPVEGICPAGWHVPTQAEFQGMIDHLGGIDGAVDALQDGGSSGFDALLTGYRCTMSGSCRPSAMTADFRAYFWTTEHAGENATLWEVGASTIQTFAFQKSLGLSLRCIWDG